jgi:predicted nucleic acid-binding protein
MSADFLDSNIFVCLFDEVAHKKRRIAEALTRSALEAKTGCISYQVVQETLNVLTRKLAVPVTPTHAQEFLQHMLMPLWRVMPSQKLYAEAIALQHRLRLSFYDALIVAAALESGCKRLFTEDLQHGQRIAGLRIENPFRALG